MKKYTREPAKVHLNSVMETIRNRSIMKNIGQIQSFQRNTGDLKKLKAKPQVQFYILKRWRSTKRAGICYLWLNEKLFIIEFQGNNLLNQKNELISKWRHKNKFKFMNYKTWPLCGKCRCSEFFSGAIVSRIWTECGDLQSKSPHSLRMWLNADQTNPEC